MVQARAIMLITMMVNMRIEKNEVNKLMAVNSDTGHLANKTIGEMNTIKKSSEFSSL